jgi:signal transduction histidine kinase
VRRAGLRARITGLFALGALGICTLLAVAAYELTRVTLVPERERSAVRAAYVDAAAVQAGLTAGGPDIVQVLRSVDTGPARRPVLRRDGQWFARTAETGLTDAIPASLQRLAEQGRPGVQRTRLGGSPVLVTAVPLPSVGATYYELNDLSELQRTLRSLATSLLFGALGTGAAGAAVGRWASGRVLRPLASVEEAATRIAAGDLDARLDAGREPDLRRLAASFNTMVDALSARLQRDRRFAADVSHELRSPLQTLSTAAELLERRRDSLDPTSAAAAGLVSKEVNRFQQLVTDLLELAKGDRPPVLAAVDVAALLRAVGAERSLAVQADGPLVVQADARRLRQVLVNLLDNADQHGGGAVGARACAVPGAVRVEVDDAGPGVPEVERDLIFDRFGRGRGSGVRGSRDGTGLGLALVAQHVQALGGTVEVLDRPGGGARFVVEVPV